MKSLYYFRKRMLSVIKNIYLEITKPTNFIKGDEFEEFLRKKIYPYPDYELVMKTHSYNSNKGDYIEMTKYPDYLFRDQSGSEFYVEAKYRARISDEKLKWSKPKQFARYKELEKTKNVKIEVAIGLGGRPKYPKRLFVIPLKNIEYPALYEREFVKFERQLSPRGLIDKVKDFLYG